MKPIKMVKGQGLAKLLTEENYDLLDINCIGESSASLQTEVAVEGQHNNWQVAEHLFSCE
jgi:hypothetical protein